MELNFQYIPAEKLKKGSLNEQLKDRAGRGLSLAIDSKTQPPQKKRMMTALKKRLMTIVPVCQATNLSFTYSSLVQTHLHIHLQNMYALLLFFAFFAKRTAFPIASSL